MKNILWDFDGVILDSMEVRDYGFKVIFKDFKEEQLKILLTYHRINGGLSRYVKIRYFFEKILKTNISEQEINNYASDFSEIMRKELVNKKNLINDTVKFIKENHSKFNFHIVSGSDQEELRFLCKELGVASYFLSIHGSPTSKNTLVKQLLETHDYNIEESCLIGDSINDYDAAMINNIGFYGYNNLKLKSIHQNYIESFNDVDKL